MFKNFDGLNGALNEVDSSKTYFLDQLENLVSTIRSGASLGQTTTEAYARAYAQVQQTKYDAEGNISDVTSADRLTVPNAILSKEASKGSSWLGQLQNAKQNLLTPSVQIDVQSGTMTQTITRLGIVYKWQMNLKTKAVTMDVDTTGASITGYAFGELFATLISSDEVHFPKGGEYRARATSVGYGPIGSILMLNLVDSDNQNIGLYASMVAGQTRLHTIVFKGETHPTQLYYYTNEQLRLIPTEIVGEVSLTRWSLLSHFKNDFGLPMIVGDVESKAGTLPYNAIPRGTYLFLPTDSGFSVGDAGNGWLFARANHVPYDDLSSDSFKYTIQANASQFDLAGIITSNAPDYTQVATELVNLPNS